MSEKDLKVAFEVLRAKYLPYTDLFGYYDGEQPLVYTSKRLREIFKDLDAYFAENWCSVVIDSCKDRVNLRGIEVSGADKNRWKELWESSEVSLESDDVHESALVTGEGYFIAWKDDVGNVQGYHNDPRLVHLFYDYANPRIKRYAAKMWMNENKKMSLTLYYPNYLEYYESTNAAKDVMEASAFESRGMAENPFGEIPVFHYRLGRRKVKSDLRNVIPIQNGINKLLTDMMVTAEYMAFPQRYIISNAEVRGKVRNAPNEILDLPAGDGMSQQTTAGQFESAKLENYLNGIDNMATAISSITRTPKHYFFSVGSNLSGEALIAMEAPLNKKAQDRVDRFEPVWKQVTLFMLRLAGATVKPENVTVNFDKPETVQPRTTAETRQMNVNAGMSLTTVWREEGKTDDWIAQALKDMEADKKRNQSSMAQVMLEAERRFSAPVEDQASNVEGQRSEVEGQRSNE